MPTHGTGAIGSLGESLAIEIYYYHYFLDYTDKEREVLALKSLNFKCPILGLTSKLLLEKDEEEETVKDEIQKYSKELTVSKPATSEKPKSENNNPGKAWKLILKF